MSQRALATVDLRRQIQIKIAHRQIARKISRVILIKWSNPRQNGYSKYPQIQTKCEPASPYFHGGLGKHVRVSSQRNRRCDAKMHITCF